MYYALGKIRRPFFFPLAWFCVDGFAHKIDALLILLPALIVSVAPVGLTYIIQHFSLFPHLSGGTWQAWLPSHAFLSI